jgi:hypothetical protein
MSVNLPSSFLNRTLARSRNATNRSRSPSPSGAFRQRDPHVQRHVGEASAIVPKELQHRAAARGESDQQIGIAVRVVVAPRRGAHTSGEPDPHRGGDVGQRAAIVAIEPAQACAGPDEQIEIGVAVVVSPRVDDERVRGEQRGGGRLEAKRWRLGNQVQRRQKRNERRDRHPPPHGGIVTDRGLSNF